MAILVIKNTEASDKLIYNGRNMGVKINKLGTIDLDIVESNPIVFNGKPWLMEYIRYMAEDKKYHANDTSNSYFRFRSLEDLTVVSKPFGHGLHMGNAFVDNGRIIVTAVEDWGKSKFYQMESTDMVNWTAPKVILEDSRWEGYNTSVCKADGRYIMVFELGEPLEIVKVPFTMFFAESKDLVNWSVIPTASFGKEFYTGGPMIRYFDGWFFMFYLNGSYEKGFNTEVMRSRDLVNWENSKANPVLPYSPEDKVIYPGVKLTDAQIAKINLASDINASDLDMCDYNGKAIFSYSWGNQRGTEFLALGEADISERDFCFSFFE